MPANATTFFLWMRIACQSGVDVNDPRLVIGLLKSAVGHERTSELSSEMSALRPKSGPEANSLEESASCH